jgi:cytochrome c-type biogenesis protein CcmH
MSRLNARRRLAAGMLAAAAGLAALPVCTAQPSPLQAVQPASLPATTAVSAAPAVQAPDAPAASPIPTLTPALADALARSERFRHLASELRCLVCQNQTLADSSAELAIDLRNEVLRQMAAGKDDAQIKAHLVERYGEFVLYRPTFGTHTLALWLGPAVLVAGALLVLWRLTRPRMPALPADRAAEGADDAALARLDRLLDTEAGTARPSTPHDPGPGRA